jgi:large subunit ribosomal protein L6
MSRIGKQPITVPSGVNVQVAEQSVAVSGKLGKTSLAIPAEVTVALEDGKIVLKQKTETPRAKTQWGTTRAHLSNMVKGVSTGFTIDLAIEGVGYRANLEGKNLNLQLGFSHDIKFPIPEGITIKVGEKQTTMSITGSDRRLVGQVAAEIRALRKPEPYKGKGIRYSTEVIRRKEGKKK